MSDRYHFYLSFPPSIPFTGQRADDLDRWVRALFTDLCTAVGRRGPSGGIAPGFADHEPDADWRAGLEGAEVLVPLYSPVYFTRTRTGRELEGFRRRVAGAGIARPERRIVPVLWTPPPPAERSRPWVRECLDLPGSPASYIENGLQALLRLWMFRADYTRLVDLLAARIVAISRDEPIGPSPVEGFDGICSPFGPVPATFAVILAASADWRPFPAEQRAPLARYVRRAAERLDFTVATSALADTADTPDPRRGPGIVLIDPQYVVGGPGATMLDALLPELPPWVLPVLVGGGEVPDRLGGVQRLGTFGDFVGRLPFLVTEAEGRFRRYLPEAPVP